MLRYALDTFWSPKIWLPPNVTWEELHPKPRNEYQFTNYKHLYLYPIPFAFVILILRYCLERFCFAPLGRYLGIKNTRPKCPKESVVLEKAYQHDNRWLGKKVTGLAKQLDWTERQVYRWLRLRKLQGKPSTLVKFCENSWRCFYYTSSFLFGLYVLHDKPWFRDMYYCWIDYPNQGVTKGVWWYYMISLAFYWSLTFSQFFDVKRNDFWQMFVHHVATISLLSLSWICNLHRVGSLILVLHDAADCILDGTKAAKYAKYDKTSTVLFAFFMITWIVTRIVVFPIWVLRSTTMEATRVSKIMFPAYYIFNGLLLLLLALHIFWTNLIIQLAYRTWTAGQLEGDIRSSGEEDSEEEAAPLINGFTKHANNNITNNHDHNHME